MGYYLQAIGKGDSFVVWEFTPRGAQRYGVGNRDDPRNVVDAALGEDILKAFQRKFPACFLNGQNPFHKTLREPGECYPRMARPPVSGNPGWNLSHPAIHDLKNESAVAFTQLIVLLRQLERICEVIHPAPSNLGAYGHEIRNLLVLACMEVESHWRAILIANGIAKPILTTREYVKLHAAMKLGGYGITFPRFPWIATIKPFAGWDEKAPTESLKWFDAYNAVKHARENNFAEGTLERTMEAVAANVIMMVAQFGLDGEYVRSLQIAHHALVTEYPTWEPQDLYIHAEKDKKSWYSLTNYPL
jgi:hypothetical protein